MNGEGISTAASEVDAPDGLFYDDGKLNEEVLADRYGLSVEDAEQEVTFGSHVGTVAQMLADERCPVGGMIAAAYADEGITGVAEKFRNLSLLDPGFSVELSSATLEREGVKKK